MKDESFNKIQGSDLEILKTIEDKFNKEKSSDFYYVKKDKIPKAYFNDLNNVKVIVLGCDPSYSKIINNNDSSVCFDTVFGLSKVDKEKIGKGYFVAIERNLNSINLKMEDIYVQNLCKSYFNKETSKIKKSSSIWDEAAKIWISNLKYEFDEFRKLDKSIPVLLTSEYLIEPLLYDYDSFILKNKLKRQCNRYYKDKIIIKPNENLLGRLLIPFFRSPYYLLNDEKIKKEIEFTNSKKVYKEFISNIIFHGTTKDV